MNKKRSILMSLSAFVLTLAMVICLAGCTGGTTSTETTAVATSAETTAEATSAETTVLSGLWADAVYTADTELGEGDTTVRVSVTAEERTIIFTVHTDKTTLGDALIEYGLVEGEMGAYGLYVKKVNGILADYDIDGTYWSLCKGGEYMSTGVDTTAIADGDSFELIRTK